jgi:transposase, IS5 family
LPQHCLFERHQRDFVLYERILKQQIKDTDKIYLLYEPQVYCVPKGKNHKQYEYGSKASITSTARSNIIVGAVSHEQNLDDSRTLPEILRHVEATRGKAAELVVCDRGYRGKSEVSEETKIILPGKALKRDTRYQKDKKRKQCRRRAAIEPIIGHLEPDYRMARNYLRRTLDDHINLLMAIRTWNLKQYDC